MCCSCIWIHLWVTTDIWEQTTCCGCSCFTFWLWGKGRKDKETVFIFMFIYVRLFPSCSCKSHTQRPLKTSMGIVKKNPICHSGTHMLHLLKYGTYHWQRLCSPPITLNSVTKARPTSCSRSTAWETFTFLRAALKGARCKHGDTQTHTMHVHVWRKCSLTSWWCTKP